MINFKDKIVIITGAAGGIGTALTTRFLAEGAKICAVDTSLPLTNYMILPQSLYRGDQDPVNKRDLKATLGSGLLLTNLCKGGIGKEIFNQPLKKSINAHVAIGWNKTHFLSFSENKETAFYYASNDKEYEETYEVKVPWDFTLMTFQTDRLTENSITQIDKGLFSAQFFPTCKKFLPSFKVFLIDVITHLKNIDNLHIDLIILHPFATLRNTTLG